MKHGLMSARMALIAFGREDDGAQVIEYALIIAVISIALVVAIEALVPGADFTTFITRLTGCLSGTGCS